MYISNDNIDLKHLSSEVVRAVVLYQCIRPPWL